MKLGSILAKVLMGITGLLWVGFVLFHLAGNLFMFDGPQAFNGYSDKLHELGPLLYVAEAGLVLFLVLHIWGAARVTFQNRAARMQSNEQSNRVGKASLASRTMVFGGIFMLVFLVIHIGTFKLGDWNAQANGLWGLVVVTYKNPFWVGWYLVAMVVLGLHLSHGLGSAFQSLGIFNPKMRAKLRSGGIAVGWLIAAAFASFPIWGYFAQNVDPKAEVTHEAPPSPTDSSRLSHR